MSKYFRGKMGPIKAEVSSSSLTLAQVPLSLLRLHSRTSGDSTNKWQRERELGMWRQTGLCLSPAPATVVLG